MVREGYQIKPKHPKQMTEEERQRLLHLADELFALREELYRRTGRIDVAALIRRARGTEE